VADRLRTKFPKLAFLLERLNAEIKRRTDVARCAQLCPASWVKS
jgi:hypothetical protein